jgi:hypothetical protein
MDQIEQAWSKEIDETNVGVVDDVTDEMLLAAGSEVAGPTATFIPTSPFCQT